VIDWEALPGLKISGSVTAPCWTVPNVEGLSLGLARRLEAEGAEDVSVTPGGRVQFVGPSMLAWRFTWSKRPLLLLDAVDVTCEPFAGGVRLRYRLGYTRFLLTTVGMFGLFMYMVLSTNKAPNAAPPWFLFPIGFAWVGGGNFIASLVRVRRYFKRTLPEVLAAANAEAARL
jgi:hypothetical protein